MRIHETRNTDVYININHFKNNISIKNFPRIRIFYMFIIASIKLDLYDTFFIRN